jgi:hypothetical protein
MADAKSTIFPAHEARGTFLDIFTADYPHFSNNDSLYNFDSATQCVPPMASVDRVT